MIISFKDKDLKEFFETSKSAKVPSTLQKRLTGRLDILDQATNLVDLSLPGFRCHPLNGFDPTRYAIDVNGAWRVTFEFSNGDASQVDLEQYH